MERCIFTSHVYVIINGSTTTKDFKVEKCLRQGDLISPLLFVLVMEVLSGLMGKSIEIGDFKRFMFTEEEEVSMLQFAGETITMVEGDKENLWSIKVILRGFKMMLRLKINFYKSN